MTFVTRNLIFPAIVLLACYVAQHVCSHDIFDTHIMFGLHLRSVLYGCVVAWLTCLSANFAQFSHTKDLIWGMKAVHPKGVRLPSFDPSRRGSWGVSSIRTLHWLVLLAFVVETIYTVQNCTVRHMIAMKTSSTTSLALSKSTAHMRRLPRSMGSR
jgi:hypothetical protein